MQPLLKWHIVLFCIFSSAVMADESALLRLCAGSDTLYYNTFPSALAVANKRPEASILLLGNVGFGGSAPMQTVKTNLTLDLNGYSLGDTLSSTSLLYLNTDTLTLRICSSRAGGCIRAMRHYNGRINAITCNKGHLYMDGVCVEATNTSDTLAKASAFGVNVGKTGVIHLSGCTVRSASKINAYAVAAYGATTVDSCTITAHADSVGAYGISISAYDTASHLSAQASVTRTSLHVAAMTKAYGVTNKGNLLLQNDSLLSNATLNDAYGCQTSGASARCSVSACTIHAEAGTLRAYGVSGAAGTSVVMEDCEVYAVGSEQTRAVTVAGNANNLAHVRCLRLRISAQGDTKTYGVYLLADGTLDSCTIDACASGSEAYALYVYTGCDTLTVGHCKLRAQAADKALVVNNNAKVVDKLRIYDGYYSEATNLRAYLPEGWSVYRLFDEQSLQEGYNYVIRPIDHPDAVVARIYDKSTREHIEDFMTVADALRYIQSHAGNFTVMVIASCRLEKDTFHIPAGSCLTVAYMDDQTSAIGQAAAHSIVSRTKRSEYACLQLLDSAVLIVDGMLEVSARQQEETGLIGTVSGEYGYGHMHLAPGAAVTLSAGAHLQAWGYITGSGTITANAGSLVREFLQLGEWKGGSLTYEMLHNSQRVFPVTHFFYQNIECPVIYYAGSRALGSSYFYIGSLAYAAATDNVIMIDDRDALFVMDSTAQATDFVRKQYDPTTDRMIWSTSGNVALKELSINTGTAFNLLSPEYVLPLGTNTTVRVLSGSLSVVHDAVLLPGCRVDIAPDAELRVLPDARLYLYDVQQWGAFSSIPAAMVSYSPSWTSCPRDTFLSSARMEVGGAVIVEGGLYTTQGGADIVGTISDEGQVLFVHGASPQDDIYQLTGTYANHQYTSQTATSAALRNANGTLTSTADARPCELFTYSQGRWKTAGIITPDPVVTNQPVLIPDATPDDRHTTNQRGQIILSNSTLYILTPDGSCYTVFGQPCNR